MNKCKYDLGLRGVDYTPQILVVYTPSIMCWRAGIMHSMTLPPKDDEIVKRNTACTSVGESLKRFRLAANMSQEQMANSAELDRSYVSHIERGTANPSVITLANLCYALGITLADLFSEVRVALQPGAEARRANATRPKTPPTPKTRLR